MCVLQRLWKDGEDNYSGAGFGCAKGLVCQGTMPWQDSDEANYQFFCDEEQKAEYADRVVEAPYASWTLLE